MVDIIATIWGVGIAVAGLNFAITFLLNIGWMVLCARRCWKVVTKYGICKRTPNLHPIYRDVQYLSQQRKLYNLKTHIVKYVLIIMCLGVEISSILWAGGYMIIINGALNNATERWMKIQSHYPHCHINPYLILFYEFPLSVISYSFEFVLFFLLFLLLSILTRYLAARYLNHPFKRTLIKYIVWFVIELSIAAICSTIYTIVITAVVYPFLLIVNWVVLLRDNLKLSRVLKSNLLETKLHSNNKVLYVEQLSAFRLYRLFQKVMLVSLFLFVTFVVTNITLTFLGFVYPSSFCYVDVIYGVNYDPQIEIPIPENKFWYFSNLLKTILLCLHSFSMSVPLLCVTFIPLIQACVKRYKSHRFVYRFNYDNINQPLIGGYRK